MLSAIEEIIESNKKSAVICSTCLFSFPEALLLSAAALLAADRTTMPLRLGNKHRGNYTNTHVVLHAASNRNVPKIDRGSRDAGNLGPFILIQLV
jgi:hypothetical protein